MKLVIDIPDRIYKINQNRKLNIMDAEILAKAVKKGIPLPKGHGRLIDADTLIRLYGLEDATKYGNGTAEQQTHSYDTMMMYEIADMIDDAPTIIEADISGGE